MKYCKMVSHSVGVNIPSSDCGDLVIFCLKDFKSEAGVLSDATSLRARLQESPDKVQKKSLFSTK